jgi:hypothetical protein
MGQLKRHISQKNVTPPSKGKGYWQRSAPRLVCAGVCLDGIALSRRAMTVGHHDWPGGIFGQELSGVNDERRFFTKKGRC